ncbi:hypothetical protein BGZ47_005196, partial [Haplosporangium gracile]
RHDFARLVCKQWYTVCKGLVPVSSNWHLRLTPSNIDGDGSDAINKKQDDLELLFSVDHVNIRVDNDSLATATSQQRLVSWEKMMATLSTLLLECDRRRVHPRLRTLHLREGILEDFTVQLGQLPRLPTLVILRIDVIVQWDIIHLFTIFRACPHLAELSVKPTYAANVPARSTHLTTLQSSAITTSQEHDIINGSHALPTMTRLRTCCLYNIVVTEPALTAILKASPRLSKLVLLGCYNLVRQEGQASNVDNYVDRFGQGKNIIHLVGTHCPDLKSFHLSLSRGGTYSLSAREVASLIETFPVMEECNLTDLVTRRTLLWVVKAAVANRITTLNLLPTTPSSLNTHEIPLREILCTFEHLVHLRAPTAVYHLEDMDLHGLLDRVQNNRCRPTGTAISSHPRRLVFSEDDPAVARQYIWVCRGLRTLHMMVSPHNHDLDSTESSLVIFAFLTRMCPRLQELHLQRRVMHLSLQGGLCLLTRLQDLERVRIVTEHIDRMNETDLLWTRPTPPSSLERFAYPLLPHRRIRNYLQKRYRGISPRADGAAAKSKVVELGREMGMDLSKLGYAEDVYDWMDEYYGATTAITTTIIPTLYNEPTFFLPKLQSFWVETPRRDSDASLRKFVKLEEKVRKMRPNVDFQLLRPPLENYYNTTLQYY